MSNNQETPAGVTSAGVPLDQVVRPLSLRAVKLTVNMTACAMTMCNARLTLAAELRCIAETLENDPDTFSESGNMRPVADYGGWEISDPWEDDDLPNK